MSRVVDCGEFHHSYDDNGPKYHPNTNQNRNDIPVQYMSLSIMITYDHDWIILINNTKNNYTVIRNVYLNNHD